MDGDPEAWQQMAQGYEQARARDDSLDHLLEWPAERRLIGDVTGRSVLDLGCGDGSKLVELVKAGAAASVGVDISNNFVESPAGLELFHADLSHLESIPALEGRRFDRILFLQSFGYAADPVHVLQAATKMLTDDGFILLTRTHPIRYAVERAEENGTSLGEEYYSSTAYPYRRAWNENVAVTKRPYTIADLLNTFSAAGLRVERAEEPQLSSEAQQRYPHKQAWLNKHLGILLFVLRPILAT